jgi:hypothetical protein
MAGEWIGRGATFCFPEAEHTAANYPNMPSITTSRRTALITIYTLEWKREREFLDDDDDNGSVLDPSI